MNLRSKKVEQMKAQANRIYPNHGYDQYSHPSATQNNKQENILERLSQENYYSPLLNLFLNNSGLGGPKVTASDKEMLLKVWNNSIVEDNEKDVIKLSDSLSSNELNLLKSKGLIAGSGDKINLTPTGKKTLVEVILDAKSSFRRANDGSMTKVAQNQNIENTNDLGVEKVKIVRNKDGKWITKEDNTDKEIKNMSNQALASMYKAVLVAEKDCFKYRQAGSNLWDTKYELEKTIELKEKLIKELESRKDA